MDQGYMRIWKITDIQQVLDTVKPLSLPEPVITADPDALSELIKKDTKVADAFFALAKGKCMTPKKALEMLGVNSLSDCVLTIDQA
ncbi:hypothetical protein, partial [Lactococcus petauri]|uniref:hypothetical protein n=1 Tax=Lactococcus petauri TaxID=1940789 RepID=UPI0021F16AE4